MAKVRVYELARELGLESKQLISRLQSMGEFVKSASSTIDPAVVRQLRAESSPSTEKLNSSAAATTFGGSARIMTRPDDSYDMSPQGNPLQGNIYVALERDHRQAELKREIGLLRKRYPALDKAAGQDPAQYLFDLLFAEASQGTYHVANLTLNSSNNSRMAAIRAAFGSRPNWPLPADVALVAKCHWDVRSGAPIMRVQGFMESAADSRRPYEVEVRAFVYQALSPQARNQARTADNLLNREALRDLPPISQITNQRLEEWREFLDWKQELIRRRLVSLRYTSLAVAGDRIEVEVISPDEKSLNRAVSQLRGSYELALYPVRESDDPWSLSFDELDMRSSPKSYNTGSIDRKSKVKAKPAQPPPDCPWASPVRATLRMALSKKDQQQRDASEDSSVWEGTLRRRFPQEGFLSISLVGDETQLRRQRSALQTLTEQGGFAPYLAEYLFDVSKARPPAPVQESTLPWQQRELNEPQRHAVHVMLDAPDLALIQGPPGTGKTTVIAEAASQLARQGRSVLVASQAHTAVDNVLDRLPPDPALRVLRLASKDPDKDRSGKYIEDDSLSAFYSSLATRADQRLAAWTSVKQELQSEQSQQQQLDQLINGLRSAIDEAISAQASSEQAREQFGAATSALEKARRDIAERENSREGLASARNAVSLVLSGKDPGGMTFGAVELPVRELQSLQEAVQDLARLKIGTRSWPPTPNGMLESLKAWHHARLLADRLTLARSFLNGEQPAVTPELAALEQEQAQVSRRIEDLGHELREGNVGALTEWQLAQDRRDKLDKQLRESGTQQAISSVREFADLKVDLAPLNLDSELDQLSERDKKARQVFTAKVEKRSEDLNSQLGKIFEAGLLFRDALDSVLAGLQTDHDLGPLEKSVEERRTDHAKAVANEEIARAKSSDAVNALVAIVGDGDRLLDRANAELGRQKARISELEVRCNQQQGEEECWSPLLREWKADLESHSAAVRDWEWVKNDWASACNLIAVTCNVSPMALQEVGQTSFDVAIIDEVSKSTPLEMLLPLMRARKAILVGDHRQLPPMFREGMDARSFEDEAEDDSSQTSLTRENRTRFEKLVTASLFKEHFELADPSVKASLLTQFRMHPQVMDLVNHFYERELVCGLSNPDLQRAHGLTLKAGDNFDFVRPEIHALWVDTTNSLDGLPFRSTEERTNPFEAGLVAALLVQINDQCRLQGYGRKQAKGRKQVGVVSFYAQQCREIRSAMALAGGLKQLDALDVEVDTVIRFQGREKPIILTSMVMNMGLPSSRKPRTIDSRSNVARFEFINVAFSRAQELLIVLGARGTFEPHRVRLPLMHEKGSVEVPVYQEIIAHLERTGALVDGRTIATKSGGGRNE